MIRGAKQCPVRRWCKVVQRAEVVLRCEAAFRVLALEAMKLRIVNPSVPLTLDAERVVGEKDQARVCVLRRNAVPGSFEVLKLECMRGASQIVRRIRTKCNGN